MKPRLYMIIPCYNEEKVLPITSEMFLEELNLLIAKDKISETAEFYLSMMEVRIKHGI